MNLSNNLVWYNRFLLLVAGLGGLLYGIDVGIIAGALPYLQDTSKFTAGQLSLVVAAVLLGSVLSTLFAGLLADLLGRKLVMSLSGLLFVISIPSIALSHGFSQLLMGRLLQGISGGLIGVLVPLYLAECLIAAKRGQGTAIFQWLLTAGLVVAAVVGMYFSLRLEHVTAHGTAHQVFAFKDHAWRSIFWVSLPPGLIFVLGSLLLAESPRWLFRRGRKEAALRSLLRSRTPDEAHAELREIEEITLAERQRRKEAGASDSLLRRKYVVPFLLACVILACNQASGVNSIIQYNATILIQSGLSDLQAHWGYLLLTVVNFLMTWASVLLIDRKGRKFLLMLGSGGMIFALLAVGLVFRTVERSRVDAGPLLQAQVTPAQALHLRYDPATAAQLLGAEHAASLTAHPSSLVVIYSCGGFRASTNVLRSDQVPAGELSLSRAQCLPDNKVVAFFSNPFASLAQARTAPLRIENALITPVPGPRQGWTVAICLYIFMAFFAIGPGVVVWLALSELMPTRIRSNGMSIALVINQGVSTTIAAVFLPTVGKYGYSTMFFIFAGASVVYFIAAVFFLPETKGKTLEEIEAHFEGRVEVAR